MASSWTSGNTNRKRRRPSPGHERRDTVDGENRKVEERCPRSRSMPSRPRNRRERSPAGWRTAVVRGSERGNRYGREKDDERDSTRPSGWRLRDRRCGAAEVRVGDRLTRARMVSMRGRYSATRLIRRFNAVWLNDLRASVRSRAPGTASTALEGVGEFFNSECPCGGAKILGVEEMTKVHSPPTRCCRDCWRSSGQTIVRPGEREIPAPAFGGQDLCAGREDVGDLLRK